MCLFQQPSSRIMNLNPTTAMQKEILIKDQKQATDKFSAILIVYLQNILFHLGFLVLSCWNRNGVSSLVCHPPTCCKMTVGAWQTTRTQPQKGPCGHASTYISTSSAHLSSMWKLFMYMFLISR